MAGEVIFLNGWLNYTDPVFHYQLYMWSWLGLVILSVLCWVAWRYGPWKAYKALWGLYYSFKAHSNAAFTTGLQLYFELISERDAKCIFDYSKWEYELPRSKVPAPLQRFAFNYASAFIDDLGWAKALVYKFGKRNMDVEIAKRLQNYEWEEAPSVTIGGIRTDIVLDADNWTLKDSPQHKAIVEYCMGWNDTHQNDQIHSYSKLQRLMEGGVVNSPGGVKKQVIVPWVRIDSAFPIAMEAVELAGAIRQVAREMEDAEKNPLSQYYKPVLIGSFGIAALIFLGRLVAYLLK
jgi:hypothetical protein